MVKSESRDFVVKMKHLLTVSVGNSAQLLSAGSRVVTDQSGSKHGSMSSISKYSVSQFKTTIIWGKIVVMAHTVRCG